MLRATPGRREISPAGSRVSIVLNAALIRSRVTTEAREAIVEKVGKISPVVVHQRVAFQHCMIDGRTAAEFEPDSAAGQEITSLLADLQPGKQVSAKPGKPASRRKVA